MTLEEYLAQGIAAYRAAMVKSDPQFFDRPENLILYRDYQSNLMLFYEQRQAAREVGLMAANSKRAD